LIKGVWAGARESDEAIDAAVRTAGGVGMACSCKVSVFTKPRDSEGWITGLMAAPSESSPSNAHSMMMALRMRLSKSKSGISTGMIVHFFAPGAHRENVLPERVYV
jgi:hypothetical protein